MRWALFLPRFCAAIVKFAALPNLETFAGFSLVMGLYLVPVGALMAQPWQATMFMAMAANFVCRTFGRAGSTITRHG